MKAAFLFVVWFCACKLCGWQDCLSDESDSLEECGVVMGVPTFAVIYYIVDMILDNKLKKKKLPVRSDSYDEWSYVDSSGEYIHSEEIKSKAEEK